MEYKRFKPMIDKFYYLIWIPTSVLMIAMTVLVAVVILVILVVATVGIIWLANKRKR